MFIIMYSAIFSLEMTLFAIQNENDDNDNDDDYYCYSIDNYNNENYNWLQEHYLIKNTITASILPYDNYI